MHIHRWMFVILLVVAVTKTQFVSELISYYSDAACTNQTGYFYSYSSATPGPKGCVLNEYSNQYVTYTYNVSEPVIEKFIGYRATLGSCPIYSDTIYFSSAALPGACMTDPRYGNSSFMLECNPTNTELTFYASDGANCTSTFGQTLDAGSCSTFFFFTYSGWCEGGGRLSRSPNASYASVVYSNGVLMLIGTTVLSLMM